MLGRLRVFYEEKGHSGILASMSVPSRELARFAEAHPAGFCDYPDPEERIRFWDGLLKEHRAVNDDSVPSACLSEFDQGLYGDLLGGQVRFQCFPEDGWISSMVAPLLPDWSGFEDLDGSLKLDSRNTWLKLLLRQTVIFAKAASGRFGISHLILINGLNLVFELIGATETYISLSTEPGLVKAAIRFAVDLNTKLQSFFFPLVPLIKGGTCSSVGQWVPGRVLNESVDPFHMTSNGRHLLPAVCSLKGLKAIHLMNDRGYPSSFEIVAELKRGCLEKVPNTDEANRCMEKVRSFSSR